MGAAANKPTTPVRIAAYMCNWCNLVHLMNGALDGPGKCANCGRRQDFTLGELATGMELTFEPKR